MIDTAKPVRVFKNLRHGCYSIIQGSRFFTAREVLLSDAEFRVRESGRQRMIKDQKRNVHAYVVGRIVDWVHPSEERTLEPFSGRGATYRPYESGSFVDRDNGDPVTWSDWAQLDDRGIVYA